MPPILPLAEIQRRLLEHQRRQKLGERVHSMTTLARRADVNPSTMYAVIAGERVNHHSQIRLSRMLSWLAEQPQEPGGARIWHIAPGGSLRTGLGAPNSLFSGLKR
ncbi:hypothetical protein [Rhodovarius sp.]|uniref:hypothetical protein n=1 Tax=Rhodovarius sp. TaxID=2972673 RepID=UPI0034A43BC7